MPTSIADVPLELFIDNIFPLLPVRDLIHLSATNRFFNSLASDEAFWHRKLQEDFNFSGSETARSNGWKFLYRRLSHPGVYVWGDRSDGRLGRDVPQTSIRQGVPYPIPLRIPGVHLVSLVAAGMSFHAIDSHGDIYVWGKLDGTTMALRSDGFSEAAKQADHPMRLKLPVKFRTISCGRLHVTALDVSSEVWIFTSWGRPIRLSSPLLDRSTPETTASQIESGWSFTSILTQSGDVLIYWPFVGRTGMEIHRMNEELNDPSAQPPDVLAAAKAKPTPQEPDVIPCHWWVLSGIDPVKLPPIPTDLPHIAGTGLKEEQLEAETKLIKIAAMDNNLIGLTNKGHVLSYGRLHSDATYQLGHWEYLPYFSDLAKVKNIFSSQESSDDIKREPTELLITHISAHYKTFIAYSTGESSVVLIGKFPASNDLEIPDGTRFTPLIIPSLQYKSVISVVLGDYHYGALTSTGKLFTWGAYSNGALGLGDPADIEPGAPGGFRDAAVKQAVISRQVIGGALGAPMPDVRTPTEVRFDHVGRKRERYCFAAAAAGWHTGALVLDLEPDDESDSDDEVQRMPGSFPVQAPPEPPAPTMPFRQPNLLPFRFGYAARGRGRGFGHPGGNGQGQ